MSKGLSEKAIQTDTLAHWRVLGRPNTLVAAIPNSRAFGQPGLTKGLPDLLVLGGNIGVGFIELKAGKGRLSPAQEIFRHFAISNGLNYAVTYGRDEPIRTLEAWGIVARAA